MEKFVRGKVGNDTILPTNKKILYDNASGITIGSTVLGDTKTISIESLMSYVGKICNIYVAYGNDIPQKFSFLINGKTTSVFYFTYMRNYSGNDTWLNQFNISYLYTANWDFKFHTGKTINENNTITTNTRYLFKLYRVEIEC